MSHRMSHYARNFFICRRLFAALLLVLGVALPLHAWAVDTDGDGVDDSIDAFPNNPEATTDTDHDGMPDSIDYSKLPVIFADSFDGAVATGWTGIVSNSPIPLTGGWALNSSQAHSGSGSLGGWASTSGGKSVSSTVSIPAQGATVSYWQMKYIGCSGSPCAFQVDATLFESPIFTSATWVKSSYSLGAGSHLLKWIVKCGGSYPGLCGYLDDVEVRANSTLVEDTDDDNDGIPDAIDPLPLGPDAVYPVNGGYKGSSLRESTAL